mgnify:CR=1 FL=1|tara:strand:- start:2541 stop:3230 length:690 start_codon:yes stop_codon:yes gene_type:complete
MNRLLIIPARGGSRRIKNKNIKKFFDKPIISYPLAAAKKSRLFKKIHVSTDSKKIKSVVKKLGYDPEFMRSRMLGRDEIGIIDVLNFVIKKFIKLKVVFDEVWCLYPCSPLISSKDLRKISSFFSKQNNSLMTVSEFQVPIYWALKKDGKKNLKPIFNNKLHLSSKIFSKSYYDNGCLIVLKKKDFFKNFYQIKFSGYEMPLYKSVDIDNMNDWRLALKFYKLNKTTKG